jgi:PIN domain nuclease of toxin-antitoxin system
MIVLDTHVWLWWVNQDTQRLKPEWLARLEGPEDVGVSAISCFEVAWLERHGRIALPCPREVWFEKALAGSGIALLPLSPRIASHDPQDRIIIATALAYDGSLMSSDTKFPVYTELAGRLLA